MNYLVERIEDYAVEHMGDFKGFFAQDTHEEMDERLSQYIDKLAKQDPIAPTWHEPDGIFPKNDQAFACHEFYRNAINYCYMDPRTGEKFRIGKLTGSMAMGHCFYRKFGENFIHTDEILKLTDTPGALEAFFAGDAPMPLLEQRRVCLREAANVLSARFQGRPVNIFVEAGFRVISEDENDRPRIVELLMSHFPLAFGQDKVVLNGQTLVFAKRPYLWPLMYQGRAMESESLLTKLEDPERIGPVVDYQIPNALRHLGILKYSDELARKIDNKVPIEKGSQEELAIRISTTLILSSIIELLKMERDEHVRPWTMVELDYELWSMGRAAAKAGLQHHLTETTDY